MIHTEEAWLQGLTIICVMFCVKDRGNADKKVLSFPGKFILVG